MFNVYFAGTASFPVSSSKLKSSIAVADQILGTFSQLSQNLSLQRITKKGFGLKPLAS